MSIANKEVYPLASIDGTAYNMGLTYKEWLIGMVANNPRFELDRLDQSNQNAEIIIKAVDAIISELDLQSNNKEGTK